MIRSPSADDLHIAAQWLDVYEGDEDREACVRVRNWLLEQAEAKELRQACKEANVSVKAFKASLKANEKTR